MGYSCSTSRQTYEARGGVCEFSLAHYREMLQRLIRRGLELVPFGRFLRLGATDGRYVLLRHDVDVALQPAYDMLQIEIEFGVRSTWFVRTRAKGYSLDQMELQQWLSRVTAAGAEIALHEEVSHSAAGQAELVAGIALERRRLEDTLGAPVLGVSTHVPKLARLALTEELARQAGFEYEAGSGHFNPLGITFYSDANRAWKRVWQGHPQTNGCPCNTEAVPLYLITHPIWWSNLDKTVTEIVQHLQAGN